MKYRLLLIKRLLEDILMFPLILFGRTIALFKPLDKEYKVFYFFPFYHTGGAEKVHALIVKATADKDCIIFFTRKSHNQAFLQKFEAPGCTIKDISGYTDNKLIYFVNIIFRGVIASYINRQKNTPVVFNGQCNFGYKLSPWIKENVRQIELIHSISNFSYIRVPFLPFIDQTVMISRQKIDEHLLLYKRLGIPKSFETRIDYIPNASEFEQFNAGDKDFSSIKVLYSGRATAEKRSYLVAEIAKRVYDLDPSIKFFMAGDDFIALDKTRLNFINYKGNIANEQELAALYKEANVVIITSSTEGFPLAVIEGMAYGCAILATPVGDIPVHINENENGFLFNTVDDEHQIIEQAVNIILALKKDSALLEKISGANIRYAQANFSFERFAADYHKIIFV